MSPMSSTERESLEQEIKVHEDRAKGARQELKNIEKDSENNTTLLAFSFDVQKKSANPIHKCFFSLS